MRLRTVGRKMVGMAKGYSTSSICQPKEKKGTPVCENSEPKIRVDDMGTGV